MIPDLSTYVIDAFTYGVIINPADVNKSLMGFSNTIDCGDEPIVITDITVDAPDDWALAPFVIVNLEYGSENHVLEFDRDYPVITNRDDFLLIYLSDSKLTISGSLPLENLLIRLTYERGPDTISTLEHGY